jgi:hypothetical protein
MKKNTHCSQLISVTRGIGFVTAAFAQSADFQIKDGALVSYRGNAAAAVIPAGVAAIDDGLFPTTEALPP